MHIRRGAWRASCSVATGVRWPHTASWARWLHRRRPWRSRRHRRDRGARGGGGEVVTRPMGAAVGVVADQLFGESPLRPHPVAVLGYALQGVERRLYADRRSAGIAHAAAGVGIGAASGAVIRSTVVATYLATAGR